MCRRWRRLALQLPASLELDLCELHEQFDEADEVQAALDEVLPALRQRAVRKLELNGCTSVLPRQAPALLARAFFPQLRRRAPTHACCKYMPKTRASAGAALLSSEQRTMPASQPPFLPCCAHVQADAGRRQPAPLLFLPLPLPLPGEPGAEDPGPGGGRDGAGGHSPQVPAGLPPRSRPPRPGPPLASPPQPASLSYKVPCSLPPCQTAFLPPPCRSGLEPQLRLLCLSFNVPPRLLLACVASHVRPAAVALSTHSGPCAWMWVPQLRALSVYLRDGGLGGDCARLGQGIAAMPQLESLTVLDVRPPASAPPYVLPGLAALPRLAKLSVQGSVPRGAWECPHLTALLCAAVSRLHLPTHAGPPQPRLRCTGLRQLRLVDCSFEAEASFPSTLCTLSQLTSLALLWNHGDMAAPELAQLQQQARLRGGLLGSGTRSALPPAFSQLRWAAGSGLAACSGTAGLGRALPWG